MARLGPGESLKLVFSEGLKREETASLRSPGAFVRGEFAVVVGDRWKGVLPSGSFALGK
jgi:hypothetical protein